MYNKFVVCRNECSFDKLGGFLFMINAKHTVVGILTIAMIGSMTVTQAYDFKASNRLAALLNNNEELVTTIAPEDIKVSPEVAEQQLNETYTEEEIKAITEKKSTLQESFVLLTYGTLNVYDTPSEDGNIIDTLTKCESVKVTESTDGWYKVAYGQGQSGYVSKAHVTDSKAEADYAAMHFDNYKRAVVKTDGSDVNIRASASKNSSIIGQLKNGTEIVLLYDENGYTKIYYGADMDAGFVVSECIELTNTWIPKSEVSSIQTAAAQRREAEAKARAEKAAKEKAAKAKAKKSESTGAYTTPATSSKGGSIVANARKYLGVRYVYGGTTPKGFDCSGLVQYVCKAVGISVNRTAASQFSNGRAVNKSDLQPGDLVFFAKSKRISHVGIYIGGGQMIHAPHTGDVVRVASINSGYYKRTYVGARRVY